MSDARYKGLVLPLPASVRGQFQLPFATALVFGQSFVASPILVALSKLAPEKQEPVLRAWMRGVLAWSGVDLAVEGLGNLAHLKRFVSISNHQSLFDVPCINTALPAPVRFVAKRSLLKVPVFGPAMRAVGTVDIDRDDRCDTLRRLREAQEKVFRRASIHFFAEGTRSPDGKLRPFKKGAAAMAMALQVPVLPIAVVGTRHIFPKGSLKLQPGVARVVIGQPVPVAAQDTPAERARLIGLVHEQIRRMLLDHGEPANGPLGATLEVSRGG